MEKSVQCGRQCVFYGVSVSEEVTIVLPTPIVVLECVKR